MQGQQRNLSPGRTYQQTLPPPQLQQQSPVRQMAAPQGSYGSSVPQAPVRAPPTGPPSGWQPQQAMSQGQHNPETFQALLSANLLTEALPVRHSLRTPTETVLEQGAAEMAVGGSSPSNAPPPSHHDTSPNKEATPETVRTGGQPVTSSSMPRPFTFGEDFVMNEVPADTNRPDVPSSTQDESLASTQNRFESSWKMLQGSLERLIGMGNVQTTSSLFSACTKVPGSVTPRRADSRLAGDSGEFNFDCMHIEPSIIQQQREDGLDAVLPPPRQRLPTDLPVRLPTRWYVKTSPPTHAAAQSGGATSGTLGYSDVSSDSATPSSGSFGYAANSQPSADGRRMLGSQEVQELMLGSRCFMYSKKGNKNTAPNQDRGICACMGAAELYGVFDGHGEHGHFSSELCNELLPKLLLRALVAASPGGIAESGDPNPQDAAEAAVNWQEATIHAYLRTHGILEGVTLQYLQNAQSGNKDSKMPLLDARASGTTATVILFAGDRTLVSHAGDSRAVLGTRPRGNREHAWKVTELTQDHKPELPYERARIERAGAQIILSGQPPNQVQRIYTPQQPWPMINMTRSLGDLHAHSQGLSAEAEVQVFQRLWDPSTEEAVLLVCSDGVWDVINSEVAIEYAAEQLNRGMDPANRLAHEAYVRWQQRGLPNNYSDDITVVAKFF